MNTHSLENNKLTTGVIWKELLSFFFPILFGTLFQMLYNTVDAIVVGRFISKQALAAVGGGTATAINLLVGFFVGLSSGATVIISHYFGAKDKDNVFKSLHNACAIAFWGGLIISAAGFFASSLLLKAIGTPDDVFPLAVKYMRIYFAGGVIVVMYNIGSAIFRAFGDSKSPLIFLIIGCFSNIILDVVFVAVFNLGVQGAAYATVLSQTVSLFFIIRGLRKQEDCCHLEFRNVKIDSYMLKRTLSIGLPAGIQSIMYSISNLMIQSSINSFGTDTAAAWAAYGRLDSMFWMIINSFGIAITTFVGQNYGANEIGRSKKGVKDCLGIAFGTTFFLEIIYLVFVKQGYMLFTTDPEVISIGKRQLFAIAPFYFTFVCVEILSGAIRGTGKTLIPTIITIVGICGLRSLWLLIIPLLNTSMEAMLFCYPLTWIITSLAFIVYYKRGHIYDN